MNCNFRTVEKIVRSLLGLDMCFVEDREEMLLDYLMQDSQQASFFPDSTEIILRRFHSIEPNCIYEVTTYLNLHYQILYVPMEHLYFILGPCAFQPLSAQKLLECLHRYQSDELECQAIASCCQHLPVVSYVDLHQLSNLLAQAILETEGQIPFKRWDSTLPEFERNRVMLVDHYEEFAKIRRVELRYEFSAALNEAVKKGNLYLAYWFSQQIDFQNNDLVRTSNNLRNAQNICIITNTQLRHTLEECGIHPYRLDAVSGEIARSIEKLTTVKAAENFAAEIIRRYCELSQENFYLNLKPFSRMVVAYIKSHLSDDNLTVKDIAKVLMVNPDYLSTRFHQEVGKTVIDFINQERIDLAAALLKRTSLQIQQISSAIGYNNTSYFTKQFKRYRGMPPRAFRKDGVL